MNTDDAQPMPQEAMSSSALRQKLQQEIAGSRPPPHEKPLPPELAEAASIAGLVDSLFLHRWLEGTDNGPKKSGAAGFEPGTSPPKRETTQTLRHEARRPATRFF